MARKKRQEEHENHERWLVSYADFITLLFAFFVVMYAISSVNEGKYRVLSDSLVSAFDDPTRSLEPIQLGTPIKDPIIQHNTVTETTSRVGVDYSVVPNKPNADQANPVMQRVADDVTKDMKDLIDQGLIAVHKNNSWVEIEIKSSILFSSGDAHLADGAQAVLQKIAKLLADVPNQLQVEGFTDNLPIATAAFPSNWELSGARAASVVRLFADAGISPARLSATGFGEHRPIASNLTETERSKNRRVAIVVLADNAARRTEAVDPAQRSVIQTDPGAASAARVREPLRLGQPVRLGAPASGTAGALP